MKWKTFIGVNDRLALIIGICLLAAPVVAASAQVRSSRVYRTIAVSSANPELPKGLRLIARVPLQGQPITRMYTQSEYGHSYLYLEHGQESVTSMDVSNKRIPQIVDHQPGRMEPAQYEQLAAVQSPGLSAQPVKYSNFQTALDAEHQQDLSRIPDGKAKTDGITVGQTVATQILPVRANDGADVTPPGSNPRSSRDSGGLNQYGAESEGKRR